MMSVILNARDKNETKRARRDNDDDEERQSLLVNYLILFVLLSWPGFFPLQFVVPHSSI